MITGDCHGVGGVEARLKDLSLYEGNVVGGTALIILGDAGLNFWLNKTERKHKRELSKYNIPIYCVRGNHEERPEYLGYQLQYDEDVNGEVYVDDDNDMIRYFQDGGEYVIDGLNVLTIGGAYSVDKDYRLQRAAAAGTSFTGWFPGEQLGEKERADIRTKVNGKYYDFILTHTCPYSWEPRDLFLGFIEQDKVDKTMEWFLQDIACETRWCIWCFGHYHANRAELPCVEQLYYSIRPLRTIFNDWTGEEHNWHYLEKSPQFYYKPTLKGEKI
jgi:3-oxoacid CoA-transferase subunit A